LTVQHAPISDDHDRVEHAPVGGVVKCGELVGQPREREALATARRVLNEVPLAGSRLPSVGHQEADGVQLLVSREDQEPLAGLATLVVLLLDLVDELAHEVEHAVTRPRLLDRKSTRLNSSHGSSSY